MPCEVSEPYFAASEPVCPAGCELEPEFLSLDAPEKEKFPDDNFSSSSLILTANASGEAFILGSQSLISIISVTVRLESPLLASLFCVCSVISKE